MQYVIAVEGLWHYHILLRRTGEGTVIDVYLMGCAWRIRRIKMISEEGYDLMVSKGFIGLHICSECNGTREITGHKHWCSWNKKKAVKDE